MHVITEDTFFFFSASFIGRHRTATLMFTSSPSCETAAILESFLLYSSSAVLCVDYGKIDRFYNVRISKKILLMGGGIFE